MSEGPHRADGHACSANLPAPLGRPCPWCGALPYVLPGTPEGPVERVAFDSERAKVLFDRLEEGTPGMLDNDC